MELSEAEFKEISRYVELNYGINLEHKRNLIAGRLENYLVRNGYSSYSEYMQKIKSDPTGKAANSLVNQLTTNHTYFLRENLHFDYMRDIVLPQIYEKERDKKSIYIWCGAASTGEEPYTIVMTLHDFFKKKFENWDTRILATDISTQALSYAQNGVYMNEQLDSIPPVWKKNYFEKFSDDRMRVKQSVRDDVIYRVQNLMEPFSFKNKFHIVFLRNVMIYFKDDTKYKLINNIYNCMRPGGYLFIGMSEVLDKRNTNFRYIQSSIYQKI